MNVLLFAALVAPTVESAKVFFVPELRGAVLLDVTLEGRLHGIIDDDRHGLPRESIRLHAGYLHYVDGHGAVGVGGYVGGGASLSGSPAYTRADVGAIVRLRGISADFYHVTVGAFVEGGLVASPARAEACGETCEALGTRYAVGLEMGGGVLWYLQPHVFAEYVGRVGVESLRFDGRSIPTLFAALRVVFDFAIRGRR